MPVDEKRWYIVNWGEPFTRNTSRRDYRRFPVVVKGFCPSRLSYRCPMCAALLNAMRGARTKGNVRLKEKRNPRADGLIDTAGRNQINTTNSTQMSDVFGVSTEPTPEGIPECG